MILIIFHKGDYVFGVYIALQLKPGAIRYFLLI